MLPRQLPSPPCLFLFLHIRSKLAHFIQQACRFSPMAKEGAFSPPRRKASSPASDVKLAAVALGLNVRLRSADMPAALQERAFRSARALLDEVGPTSRPNPTSIAMALKKEFDASYGPAWHCVVGKSFGSFMTHSPGGFLYFSLDNLSVLLFKTEVTPVVRSPS